MIINNVQIIVHTQKIVFKMNLRKNILPSSSVTQTVYFSRTGEKLSKYKFFDGGCHFPYTTSCILNHSGTSKILSNTVFFLNIFLFCLG